MTSQDIKKTSKLNPSLWDNYPWQGQGGIKVSGGTHNQFYFEIAYMKSIFQKKIQAIEFMIMILFLGIKIFLEDYPSQKLMMTIFYPLSLAMSSIL
ncbi:MAG: hypothetical protein HWD58_20075 [Bacteroidota bacterium]|nr:MAG: hypothetical protein HWD58_20075 [Bacteroidota bacterium]